MIYRNILTFFLLTLIPLSAKALPPPSPAGGNYLVLDGIDDYAVLNFETFGILLPEGTDEFTVEAWVYPTKHPDKRTTAAILSQQVQMTVVSDKYDGYQHIKESIDWQKGDLLLIITAHVAGWGGGGVNPFFPMTISPNQWHHIAYQAKRRETITIVNDLSKTLPQGTTIGHDLSKFWRPKDFTLGGFGEKIELRNVRNRFWGSFTGYIDEVRISTVARYDVSKNSFMPNKKFKNDGKTVALWHFDEPGGSHRFSDASDNAYHLVGNGGAKTSIPLAITPMRKLTTIWGSMKRSRE
ncbi:LamG domain-containing protein [Candidatus Poribacteria bacterium]|nr:LamG domain-containing protein [Candidatus Poribacteria bacterium]MYG05830.1 LamG domain-containing protein [Candidatus Poribacteria bacterium]MYK25043.1 LamG domain-containing protein [Candidatus Poribacteria bacterium]